jgi:hypothetical protein
VNLLLNKGIKVGVILRGYKGSINQPTICYKNSDVKLVGDEALIYAEVDIPITKDAYTTFLTSISNVNSPVSQLFGSNVALADLLPAYSSGDVSGAMVAQYLFNKYSDILQARWKEKAFLCWLAQKLQTSCCNPQLRIRQIWTPLHFK